MATFEERSCFHSSGVRVDESCCVTDVVFLKAWSGVKVDEVYSVQAEHMLPPGHKDKWPQMKTVGQLRREQQLHRTVNPDHLYKV